MYGDLEEQSKIFKDTLLEILNSNGKLISEDAVIELANNRMKENRDIVDSYYEEKAKQKTACRNCLRVVRQNFTPAILGGVILLSSMYVVPMFKDDIGQKYDHYYKKVPTQVVSTITSDDNTWEESDVSIDGTFKDFVEILKPLNDGNGVVMKYTYYFSSSGKDVDRKSEIAEALENNEDYDYTTIMKNAEDYKSVINEEQKETKITLTKYVEGKKYLYSDEKEDGYHMPIHKLSIRIGSISLGFGIGKLISRSISNAKNYGDYRSERLEHKELKNAARKKLKRLKK